MNTLNLRLVDVKENPSYYTDFVEIYGQYYSQVARTCAHAETDADVDAVLRLFVKTYDCYEIQQRDESTARTVGVAVIDRTKKEVMELETFVIKRNERNKGLGRVALDLIIQDAVNDEAYKKLIVKPPTPSTPAYQRAKSPLAFYRPRQSPISLYERAGFVFDEDGHYMELDLAAARKAQIHEPAALPEAS